MCEVESPVLTGEDIASPTGLLNESCPEGIIREVEREEETLLTKSSSGEPEEEEIPQEVLRTTEEEEAPSEEDVEVRRGSVGTEDPKGDEPEIPPPPPPQESIPDGDLSEEPEGVDPFKPVGKSEVINGDLPKEVVDLEDDDTALLRQGTTLLSEPSSKDGRRDSKTVSFREPDKQEDAVEENDSESKEHLALNSTSSNGTREGDADGAVEKMRSTSNKQQQRPLGENNPVYRLSMKLSPNLFNIQEIPGANQHREVEKAGYLTKLSGRSFPYIAQWKRRYCVLSKGRLYYYEREDSKSGEKSNGVINLEYFDQVSEAGPKDCKKATNVFVITSQDRSFFDPGRHLFSADTLPDLKDWVRKLQSALEQTRNNNRPPTATSASPSIKKDGGKKPKEPATTTTTTTTPETNSQNNTKERKKKKEPHRPRKSSKVADVPDGHQNPESASAEPPSATQVRESELPKMTSPIGIQLPGMTSVPRGGVALPGLSPTRKEPLPAPEDKKETATSEQTDEGLPVAGPTLACVNKQRNKGPQGRRAPQNRRSHAASALKKRASSLSALEHQDLNDNSEAQWLNKSLDMLDEATTPARNGELATGCGPALPYKAYNYSSDDETDDDVENSQSDSFPTSAAAMPPPPPPRSASYGLELRQNPQLGQTGQQALHRSLGDARGSGGDVRGSKHSLREGRVYGLVGEWHGCSSGEQWIGSHSSIGQNGEILGSASPVMDDLDNMLMNQSIQQTSLAVDSASESGSEGSGCRLGSKRGHALQPNHHHHHPPGTKHSQHCHKRAGPDLTRFAMAVKHLQRHVVEIDRAVFSMTGDMTGTRQDVTSLKEAVLALQADTDTITTTLSHLTEEAISAQQKITFATQEAEKVRKIANIALKEAEQARQEQLKSKKEYEALLDDMRATMKGLKESQVSYSFGHYKASLPTSMNRELSTYPKGQDGSISKTSLSRVNIELKGPTSGFRPAEECLKSSSPKSSRASAESQPSLSGSSKVSVSSSRPETDSKTGEESSKSATSKSSKSTGDSFTSSSSSPRISGNSESGVGAPPPVSKSSSFTQVSNTPKVPAYQSLFARPSSLISGLTQRSSLTKSVSFAEDKSKGKTQEKGDEGVVAQEETEKMKEGKQQSAKKEEKQQGTKKEEKHQMPKKEEKQQSTLERKERKENKHQREDKAPSYDTNSKERKSKEKKDHGSIDRKERKHRHAHKRSSHRGSKDEEHMISNLSLEDIPMADDHSNELLDRVGVTDKKPIVSRMSSLSSSTQTPSNFSLGKSSSSPIVTPSLLANHPRSLPLSKDHHKTEFCNSTASTPESSAPPCPFPQPLSFSRPTSPTVRSSSSTLPTVAENHSTAASSLKAMHRPGSTPGPLSRQGSMTTVPEDRAVVGPPPSRPGVFAISRQNSSPNIPLQRQNSGPSIPLQRQYSLGMVPEESRLPRQESLMSVPEDRPVVDQTLPLSPSQSMTNFPLSPSVSASTVSEAVRRAARASMELVTGPVLAGSAMQEAAATGTLAVLTDPEEELSPTATSTLKKEHKSQKDVDGVVL
ncbi:uncharacterized protein LOC135223521 isoform X2 [Macrobrachium nipponense]|uniref:uncharacterized protein LOC135223521 isoform X2 n=1 Tax=Macrobrachium nipponense TaxID=159736 RepID=UPI0030C8830C